MIHRFRALGLEPAGQHGGWTQQVPLVHNIAGVPTRLEVSVGGSILSLVAGRDISPRTIRPLSQVTIHDAPMVFMGYGVAAPERDWDDFKGFDLHGKVAIFLVNDPHFEANPGEPAASKFGGPGMTYYGRWNEVILFGAHWDAYGIGPPDAQGQTIRRGANDDALGVAGVLELARAFARGPRTERTLVFAAWTAEEAGLFGSEAFGIRPLFPLEKMVANLTIDVMQTAGPARDVVLLGAGQNDLEDDLSRAAHAQGRTVTPDPRPGRGLFFRADHFSFAKRGVPTLLLMALGGGEALEFKAIRDTSRASRQ